MGSPADWYDLLNPWDASDDFYLDLVMGSDTVVDVGCGTGRLLHRARELGHRGRLIGVDPDADMLAIARRRTDIEWRQTTAARLADVDAELIVMTGHAFQTLVTDDDLTASLRSIQSALAADGRYAFETRNPAIAPWQHWDGEFSVVDDAGQTLTVVREVLTTDGHVVAFDESFSAPGWVESVIQHSTLRFLTPVELSTFLSAAGLTVDVQFGNWQRDSLAASSPEIISIARRLSATSTVS